jgi:hypothetical protein
MPDPGALAIQSLISKITAKFPSQGIGVADILERNVAAHDLVDPVYRLSD